MASLKKYPTPQELFDVKIYCVCVCVCLCGGWGGGCVGVGVIILLLFCGLYVVVCLMCFLWVFC